MEEYRSEEGDQETTDSQELKHRPAGKPKGRSEEKDAKDGVINPVHFLQGTQVFVDKRRQCFLKSNVSKFPSFVIPL